MAQEKEDKDEVQGMRRGLLQGAGLSAALALMGGMGGMITPAQAAEGGSFPAHKRWKIVFVNHVTTNPFFVPTQYGIQDATALLGMDYQWTGSANADIGEMVNAVNAAIAAKADAIAVPIVDPKAFDKPIQAALDAGIPVFAYNADAPVRLRQIRALPTSVRISICLAIRWASESQPHRQRPRRALYRHAGPAQHSATA